MASQSGSNLIEGYIEKKKRRAYQGYAKRYFILQQDGQLSYSRTQGEKVRDTVDLHKCSIGRSKKRRHLVIDSGDKVPWHCKAPSDKEFERWTAAFHNFAQVHEQEGASSKAAIASASAFSSASQTTTERLVTDGTAEELVRLMVQMTPCIHNLEQYTLPKDQQTSGYGVTQLVGAVASTVIGSKEADQQKEEVAKNVMTLRKLHQKALDVLHHSHLAPDRASMDSLDRAESIYHDAESVNYAYELDEDDNGSGESSGSFSSASGAYDTSDDESSAYASGEDIDDDAASSASDKTQHVSASNRVKRRSGLPHPAGPEPGVFGLLKKNMGKDLQKVSFPVTTNEPVSALQSMAESMQYTELLDQAVKMSDSSEKLLYVTVFAITTYAKYKYRASRKPFNPLLGETYELVRPDKGLKFLAEKVSHHPNWLACFAQGTGWDYTATESGQSKFYGRSMEIMPQGIAQIRLEDGGLYTFTRPPSYVRGILGGEKYIEHIGDMEVTNVDTGERAVVTFKAGSWGGASTRNKIEGQIFDAHDHEKISITGKWDDSISRKTGSKSSEIVWQSSDFLKDAPKWYGFSEWTAQLNEITDDIKDVLPPTDSRLRPDQRAYEEGNVDKAEEQKHKLEVKQRERRAKWEAVSKDAKPPQFFKGEDGGEWHYTGGYWERREKREWRREIQIFEM